MDSRKRLIITSVISIVLVSILMIGSTYSIFNSSDMDEEKNVYHTGSLMVTVVDSGNVAISDSTPLSKQNGVLITPYRITVKNEGTVPYKFNVILDPTTATDEINHQYIMTKVGDLEPKRLDTCTNNAIKEDVILLAGASVDIDVRVWISDAVQNTEMNKSFSGKLKIDGVGVYYTNEEVDNSVLTSSTVLASSVSYDNSTTGVDCSNVQCMIDKLDEMVEGR